MIYTAR